MIGRRGKPRWGGRRRKPPTETEKMWAKAEKEIFFLRRLPPESITRQRLMREAINSLVIV
jgi:hypothetical protein